MLRRPFSSLLSSLSIGSRLSTRLFSATATSTDDQITTVRTTGSRWFKHHTTHTVSGVYWGEGDPRNTKVDRRNDNANFKVVRLRSLAMALDQAHKDGLQKIRVQTDLDMTQLEIQMMAQKFKTRDASAIKDMNLGKYCERIAKIMDEMEVILEYRKPWFEDRKGNEVVELLNEDIRKRNGESDTVVTSPYGTIASGDAKKDRRTAPIAYSGSIVRTTGFLSARDGIACTSNGIYWGKDDPRNTRLISMNDITDTQGTQFRSVLMALEQAQKDGLKQICVQTDSGITRFNMKLRLERFKSKDITAVKDVHLARYEYCERILKIMDEMEVIFEYRSPWSDFGNEVMFLLSREESALRATTGEIASINFITPAGVSSLESRTVPTVYVRGKVHYVSKAGASASLWVPDSIEHLEINQRPVGSIQQLTIFPATHSRAQILAILNAIKEAQALNLPEILVITDSGPFLYFFSRDWKGAAGKTAHSEDLYLEIKALTETIKVHFKKVRYAPDCDDEMLKKVHEMAKEGLGYPVLKMRSVKE